MRYTCDLVKVLAMIYYEVVVDEEVQVLMQSLMVVVGGSKGLPITKSGLH